jgi:hypothetical protein
MTVALFAGCKRSENTQPAQPVGSTPATAERPNPVSSSAPATTSNASETKAKTDACALLTTAEIESVQSEVVKETKLSGSSQRGFSVSQCFFTLPTFTKSISLQVTQRGDGAGGRDPSEFWRETFHRDRESEKEREAKKKAREEEEEGESAPPLKVTGVGDEAYWVGSRVGGALYVLKGNSYIRVAIGGAGSQNNQIQRSKALAHKVTARL